MFTLVYKVVVSSVSNYCRRLERRVVSVRCGRVSPAALAPLPSSGVGWAQGRSCGGPLFAAASSQSALPRSDERIGLGSDHFTTLRRLSALGPTERAAREVPLGRHQSRDGAKHRPLDSAVCPRPHLPGSLRIPYSAGPREPGRSRSRHRPLHGATVRSPLIGARNGSNGPSRRWHPVRPSRSGCRPRCSGAGRSSRSRRPGTGCPRTGRPAATPRSTARRTR